jgi:hypothetical protein
MITNSKRGRVPLGIPRPAAGGRNFGVNPVPHPIVRGNKEPTSGTAPREGNNLAQANPTVPVTKD